MWQMSSVFSHDIAQRNDAVHLKCENVFKTTRPFCYQRFRVSTRQAMLQNIFKMAAASSAFHENLKSLTC